MSEAKAIALSKNLTARCGEGCEVMLFIPMAIYGGAAVPAQQLYLTRESIAKLAEEFPVEAE